MIIPIKIFKVLNLISHSAILVTRQIFLSCFVFLKESFFMIVYDPPQGAFSAFSIHLVSTTLEMTRRGDALSFRPNDSEWRDHKKGRFVYDPSTTLGMTRRGYLLCNQLSFRPNDSEWRNHKKEKFVYDCL